MKKTKETLASVAPIVLIVLILNFTLVPLDNTVFIRFIIGTLALILGVAVFLLGVDIGLTPVGNIIGRAIAKSNNMLTVILVTLMVSMFISIAEPDLHIYGEQVDEMTGGILGKLLLVFIVSAGIAVMLSLGMIRIVHNWQLRYVLWGAYALIGVLAVLAPPEYLAISFDASGATTGSLTVPFILALAAGVSALKKDSTKSEADSFGLVAIASSGAIIAVLIASLLLDLGEIPRGTAISQNTLNTPLETFLLVLPQQAKDVALGLTPILVTFLLGKTFFFELPRPRLRRILFGMGFAYIGLVLFLTGVNGGFMEVGRTIGQVLAQNFHPAVLLGIAFILGLVTILAEPAIYVLMDQVEDVTSGYVRRGSVLGFLAVGVGLAVFMSTARLTLPWLELWHILSAGYLAALTLMFFTPKLFVGIAFDSGGVASGPMTATFVLAFTQGAAAGTTGADVVIDGLGVISLVAMTPLIAVQILGLMYRIKTRRTNSKGDGK